MKSIQPNAYFYFCLNVFPYFKKKNGTGINKIPRHPNKVTAHLIVKFVNIRRLNNGKLQAKLERTKVFAAMPLTETTKKQSII